MEDTSYGECNIMRAPAWELVWENRIDNFPLKWEYFLPWGHEGERERERERETVRGQVGLGNLLMEDCKASRLFGLMCVPVYV